jgi:hypothetical protein
MKDPGVLDNIIVQSAYRGTSPSIMSRMIASLKANCIVVGQRRALDLTVASAPSRPGIPQVVHHISGWSNCLPASFLTTMTCAGLRIAYSCVSRPGAERKSGVAVRGGSVACDVRDGAIEPSASPEIEITKVSLTKHLGHSKVCASKSGLSGSMSRNDIASSHF